MISSYLSKAVRSAAAEAGYSLEGPVMLETPRDPSHGDLATNVAMQLAGGARKPPRQVAETILAHLVKSLDPARIGPPTIAGPGFINFMFQPALVQEGLQEILEAGAAFGRSEWGAGEKVLLEFVSANPTGPLNIVSARAAAVGDALTRLFNACGFEAHSEFYVNDAGNQVRLLGESVKARLLELDGKPFEIPENGYHGEDVRDIASAIRAGGLEEELRAAELLEPGRFGTWAVQFNLARQKADLEKYGVSFERFFHESEIHARGLVTESLEDLRARGYIEEKDGALWFRSTEFGDDKERVVVRSSGEPTYFLADTAYHREKHARGYGHAIDFWGPDHHGAVPRIKASMTALGYPPDWLEVVIVQQVNLKRGGQLVDMSKRAGNLVTLRELLDDVGVDVARFFFLMRSVTSHLDFDLDLAREQSDKNPVFYVQYAHARACSVERFAMENGVDPAKADLRLLREPEEMALIKELMKLPLSVEMAVRLREPMRVTNYLMSVGQMFHPFYHRHRVVTSDPALSAARLRLVNAVRQVLGNGLSLLGISAPEKM